MVDVVEELAALVSVVVELAAESRSEAGVHAAIVSVNTSTPTRHGEANRQTGRTRPVVTKEPGKVMG